MIATPQHRWQEVPAGFSFVTPVIVVGAGGLATGPFILDADVELRFDRKSRP